MIFLYLALLACGICLFMLSFVAQFRLAALLRQRYPQHWAIVVGPESSKPSRLRTWMRLQHALRSPALLVLEDTTINGWLRVWRYSPWLGWLSWLAALGIRLLLR